MSLAIWYNLVEQTKTKIYKINIFFYLTSNHINIWKITQFEHNCYWKIGVKKIEVVSKVIYEPNKLTSTKLNSNFYEDPMVKKWNSRSKSKERMGY